MRGLTRKNDCLCRVQSQHPIGAGSRVFLVCTGNGRVYRAFLCWGLHWAISGGCCENCSVCCLICNGDGIQGATAEVSSEVSVGPHFHLTTQGSPPCPCALLSPCASAISSFPWTSVEWKRTPHILSAHFMRYYKPASTIELWLCMKAYYCSTHLERPVPSVRSRFVNVQYLHTIGLSYMDSQLGTHTHIGHTGRPKEQAHIVRRQRERKQKDTDRKLGSYQWPTG